MEGKDHVWEGGEDCLDFHQGKKDVGRARVETFVRELMMEVLVRERIGGAQEAAWAMRGYRDGWMAVQGGET